MRDIKEKSGESMPYQLIQLEKTVISSIVDITSEGITNEQEKSFIDLLKKYYISVISGDFLLSSRVDSMKRLLRLLLAYPVENNLNSRKILRAYSRYWLLDMVTFFVFQLTDEVINETLIDNFLGICTGNERNLSIIYLYRINPNYVSEKYKINIDDLTPREIYYGISSGYFPDGITKETAIGKLFRLNSEKELNMLKADGLWIID